MPAGLFGLAKTGSSVLFVPQLWHPSFNTGCVHSLLHLVKIFTFLNVNLKACIKLVFIFWVIVSFSSVILSLRVEINQASKPICNSFWSHFSYVSENRCPGAIHKDIADHSVNMFEALTWSTQTVSSGKGPYDGLRQGWSCWVISCTLSSTWFARDGQP